MVVSTIRRAPDIENGGLSTARRSDSHQFDHLFEFEATAYTPRPVAARTSAPPRTSPRPAVDPDPLGAFSPAVRDWFGATFSEPTRAQVDGWAAISAGHHALIHAPTGSGKTLAAFLWCLDRLVRDPTPPATREHPGHVRVLYVSPLKALSYDIERNLRAPLAGIALAAARRGEAAPAISVGLRTGDTSAEERRAHARRPPDILITTPESLYLLLTSQARESLRSVEHVIVDEVHAIAGTKRGAHLALSLERLERLRPADAPPLQRIGLSATQRPLETIARFLGGVGPGREVQIVDAGARKPLELSVVVPVEDMGRLGEPLPLDEQPGGPAAGPEARVSIWPAIHPRILELDPGPSLDDRLLQQPAAGRAACPAAQRAGRRGARPGPPRLDRPRAAGRDRGGAQGRPAAGDRGHLEPRARDRHGRGRPRDPGRVADVGRARAPADRAGRAPGRRTVARGDLPEVPRRPARGGGRRRADACRGDRDDDDPAQPARRPRPADSSR